MKRIFSPQARLFKQVEDLWLKTHHLVAQAHASFGLSDEMLKRVESAIEQFETLIFLVGRSKASWSLRHYRPLLMVQRRRLLRLNWRLRLERWFGPWLKYFSYNPLKEPKILHGCYFCSQPFVFGGSLRLIPAQVDGIERRVFSCLRCAQGLKQSGRVRVLHFHKQGKTLHWSELNEYNPIRDYWTVREEMIANRRRSLHLVRDEIP